MNSGLDVALFPKLGEEEREEAHHKVDKLIRGQLPECVSNPSQLPQIDGLLKIKEESETDENYGKCVSNPPVMMSPSYKLSDCSPQGECSSQETVISRHPLPGNNNKSYLHMDSNRIIQAPSSEPCDENHTTNAPCDYNSGELDPSATTTRDTKADVYVWKDDEDELPSNYKTPGVKTSLEDRSHKRTCSSDKEVVLSPTSAKCQKMREGQVPGTYHTKSYPSVCQTDLSCEDRVLKTNCSDLSREQLKFDVVLPEKQGATRCMSTGSPDLHTFQNNSPTWPYMSYENHLINKRKMLDSFVKMGYEIDYQIPKLHVYDPEKKQRYSIDDTSSCAYVSATGGSNLATSLILGKHLPNEGITMPHCVC